jgi:flavin-dependent dehydrogenase
VAEHGARHDEADRRPLIAGPARPGAAEEGCHVAVLGGGPAGCATALALARLGVDGVAVVEAGRYEAVRVGESVPPDTRTPLARLGVLEAFLADGHDVCYGSCSSWGADELGYNDFLFNPHGHGWHLDRRRFDARLAALAAERGATVLTGTRFEGVEPAGDRLRLELRDAAGGRRRLTADLVVDASGFRARVARARGARTRFLDRLICVYGFLDLPPEGRFSHLTLLEAVEYGWWYAARLPGGRLAVAVAGDGATVRSAELAAPDGWHAALAATRHLAPALAGSRFVDGSLRAWPAHSFLLDAPAGDRWLAVGDAASTYDPISSQGIHKALAGGLLAAGAVHRRLAGDAAAFDGYAEAVRDGFAGYAANRAYFYALETRWPDAAFWRDRRRRRVESVR